jgi:hypothetical protein
VRLADDGGETKTRYTWLPLLKVGRGGRALLGTDRHT